MNLTQITPGSGTLIVAAYVSDGIVVGADSLEVFTYPDGKQVRKFSKRKIVPVDERMVCAVGNLATIIAPYGVVDFISSAERGAVRAKQFRKSLDFIGKCGVVADAVAKTYDELRQRIGSDSLMDYPDEVLTRLFFFGFEGKRAKSGLIEFKRAPKNIVGYGFGISVSPMVIVIGPRKAVGLLLAKDRQLAPHIENRVLLKAAIDPNQRSPIEGAAKSYAMTDLTLSEARELVKLFIAIAVDSKLDLPEEFARPIMISTVSRDPKIGYSEETPEAGQETPEARDAT